MIRSKKLILFLVPLIFITPNYSHALSLSEAIRQGWDNVPALRNQLVSTRELYGLSRLDRVRRFLPNDPQLQYSNNDNRTAEVFSLNESVGFPGKSIALSRLDRAKEEASFNEISAKKYDIARDVSDAYLTLAVSQELLAQQKLNIDDLESAAKSIEARYASGIGTQAESILINLQLWQQKADLKALEDKVATGEKHLRRLLILPDGNPLSLVLPDDLDDSLLNQMGDKTANELRADAAVNVAKATSKTAWWNQLPDISLGYAENHYLLLEGSPNGEEKTHSYNAGLIFPIFYPFSFRTDSKRLRLQSDLDLSSAQLQKIAAMADREEAEADYDRSKNRLQELRKKDLPYAEALLDSSLSAYTSGKIGLAELVLARKTLADLRAQDVQLRNEIIGAHLRSLSSKGHSS